MSGSIGQSVDQAGNYEVLLRLVSIKKTAQLLLSSPPGPPPNYVHEKIIIMEHD